MDPQRESLIYRLSRSFCIYFTCLSRGLAIVTSRRVWVGILVEVHEWTFTGGRGADFFKLFRAPEVQPDAAVRVGVDSPKQFNEHEPRQLPTH